MRHRVAHRKLGRTSAHRKAMLANMASSLVLHERIETTLPKAKELRRIADRMVTLGKRKTLGARRRAVAMIRDKKAVHKLFEDLAARFSGRNGGYTRIYKLGWRRGDLAPMAVIEYLPGEQKGEGVSRKAKEKKVQHKEVPGKKTGAAPAEKPITSEPVKRERKKAAPKAEKKAVEKKAKKAGGVFARFRRSTRKSKRGE